jgi:hypothetical protein
MAIYMYLHVAVAPYDANTVNVTDHLKCVGSSGYIPAACTPNSIAVDRHKKCLTYYADTSYYPQWIPTSKTNLWCMYCIVLHRNALLCFRVKNPRLHADL